MNPQSKGLTCTGWIIAGLVSLMMVFSAIMKLQNSPQFAEQFTGKFGYPKESAQPIGAVELACVVIFLIPQTSVLGAVLLTGYLGGAVATNVRVHENYIAPIIVGVFVWGALFLRDARIRALLPLRRSLPPSSSQG